MASPPELLALVERVREELERHGSLNLARLSELARQAQLQKHLNAALRFLVNRDEILLDVERQAIHSRRDVASAIRKSLQSAPPHSINTLAQALPFGFATICDALGWMEREGRVRIISDEQVELRN